jgi:Tol biopolymer transport system component
MRAEFVWVTRDGVPTPVDPGLTFNPGYDNRGFSLKQDGSSLAYSAVAQDGREHVFVKPLPLGAPGNLNTGLTTDVRPRWMPGSDSVVTISLAATDGGFHWGVFAMPSAGSGSPEEMVRYITDLYEAFPSPDGAYLALRSGTGPGDLRRDILGFRLGTDSVFPVTENGFNEKAVSFSPNGRFVLYQSDELGRDEIYVRSFPDHQVFESVSTNGGSMPLWSHDGEEIFFLDPDGFMTAAGVTTDPEFRIIDRKRLFQLPEDILTDEWYTLYELASDDERFLMIRVLDPEESRINLFMKKD